MANQVATSITLDSDLIEELDRLSEREKRSRSKEIDVLIREALSARSVPIRGNDESSIEIIDSAKT